MAKYKLNKENNPVLNRQKKKMGFDDTGKLPDLSNRKAMKQEQIVQKAWLADHTTMMKRSDQMKAQHTAKAAGSTISAGMGGSFLDPKTKKFKQGKLR